MDTATRIVESPRRATQPVAKRVATKLALMVAMLAAALGSLVALGVAPASAATYLGNPVCQKAFRYVDNAGAEACLQLNASSKTSLQVTPGAYDYRADGHSALSSVTVAQIIKGTSLSAPVTWVVVASNGAGYSESGALHVINRLAGTTGLHITITACTYESKTGVRLSCGTDSWNVTW